MRRLRLICPQPRVDLTVNMGDGPATPTAGIAAWEVIERVEGKSITDRGAVQPFSQDVPVFLDGWAKGNSVQRQLDTILSLGGENPGVFRAFGPIHHSGRHYIFGGEPEFGEVIRDHDGTLLRQRLTLRLAEYVRPDLIRRRRRRRGQRMGLGQARAVAGIGPARPLTYTVRAGDTLPKIAARELGDWKRWPEIGRRNGIRDPQQQLQPGRVLRLP